MKIKCISLILIAFLFNGLTVSAQNQGNQWYFGNVAGLNFNSGSPVPITTSNISIDEGCASIADKTTGNLLFYTDGNVVYDATNTVMPNGTGLGAGDDGSCTQGAVIVPKPGDSTIYYIFTSTAQVGFYGGTDSGFNVNVVDMSLNGGLGNVTTKDSLLLTPTTEKCATTLACNGIDYWVVAHQWNSDAFYAYLITSNGISAPVISHSGIVHQNDSIGENAAAVGYMRISTDGKKLALAISLDLNAVQIFDFDNSTGVITNPLTDTDYPDYSGEDGPYGICFSPDNTKLYVTYETYYWGGYDNLFLLTSGNTIYQYNLLANNIIASRKSVGYADLTLGAIQQAPDGKLYVATWGKDYIGAISNPDSLDCNYTDSSVSLGYFSVVRTYLSFYGLPDIIPNYSPSANSTVTISSIGDSLISSDTSYNQWYFNNTPIQDSTRQVLIVKGMPEGWYGVTVTNPANRCNSSDSIYIAPIGFTQISVYPNPTNNQIIIKINSSTTDLSGWNLKLIDILGRIIYSIPSLNYTNVINLETLAAAMYFVTVTNNTGRTVVPVVKVN